MRLLITVALCLGVAHAKPCPVHTASKAGVVAADWGAVFKALYPKKTPPADEAGITKALCDAQPCGPYERVSFVAVDDANLAVVLRNNGTFRVFRDMAGLPPTVYTVHAAPIDARRVHVRLSFDEFGRVPFCATPEDEAKGDCTSATVIEGYDDTDIVIDTLDGKALFSANCRRGTESGQPPHVFWAGGEFGYRGCTANARTTWFALEGERCILAPATDAKALLASGRAARTAGDLPTALALFDALVRAEPGIAGYVSERGFVRMHAGDLSGARRDLQHALTLPATPKVKGQAYFNLGLVHEKRGKSRDAKAAFEAANRLNPSPAAQKKVDALK